MKEEIFINGFVFFLDTNNLLIYDKKDSQSGIYLFSNHLTENEKKQVLGFIKYGK